MKHQVARECGFRIAGGVYLVTQTSPHGYPLEFFIRDEPRLVSLEDLNMTANGVAVRDVRTNCSVCNPLAVEGTTILATCSYCDSTGWMTVPHVFDVVGKENYPNVLDFVEETRMLGASRRAELPAEEYKRLTFNSRLLLIHERAFVENAMDYFVRLRDTETQDPFGCPKRLSEHEELTHGDEIGPDSPRCARVWYYDIVDEAETIEKRGEFSMVKRQLACGSSYRAYRQHQDAVPIYKHAIFMSLPIHRVELVDPAGEFGDKLDKLRGINLPVTIANF